MTNSEKPVAFPDNLDECQVIRANHRFSTFSAIRSGERVFVKQVTDPDLLQGLQNEAWGIRTFEEIIAIGSITSFAVPRLLENGGQHIVTSWAEGEAMQITPGAPDAEAKILKLAEVYAGIDRTTQLANHPLGTATKGSKQLKQRLAKVPYADYFDQPLINGALAFLNENIPKLEPRFTHADLTPANILDDNGTLTVVDFESCSLQWPRFYDLVNYAFNRSILEPEFQPLAKKLVTSFFENIHSDASEHTQQLNTIAMIRAISIIVETLSAPDKFHNTSHQLDKALADRIATSVKQLHTSSLFVPQQ